VAPQLAATVPLAQLVPSQQPVLQASPPVQPVWQVPPVPVHARCSGQSVARLQPQLPPLALAMHSTPLAGEVTQLVHAPPFDPQVATAVPALHIVPAQQPPLQVRPPEQEVEHSLLAVLHASPLAHSVDSGLMQPHLPATHALLSVPPEQLRQVPPIEPHAPGAVPSTQVLVMSQQPPLQVAPPAQLVEHLPVVPHADSDGQSLAMPQPHAPATHAWPFALLVQSTHAPPLLPQLAAAVPTRQLLVPPRSQQPPLHCRPPAHETVHWPEALHARPAGQSAELVQPHAPETHAWPLLLAVQSAHVPIDAPQVVGPGAAQVPALQQLPEHGLPALQVVVHWLEALQALLFGQSVVLVQPHAPPPVTVRHWWPTELAAQFEHALPPAPQVPVAVPAWHMVPSQQPPLQASSGVPPHALEQVFVVGSHACPDGQSAGPLQPQVCVDTHAEPLVLATHDMHKPPLMPHAACVVPGAQVVLSQQPPLQVCVAEQVVVQLCAVVSHAVCDGQSVAALQPQVPPPAIGRHRLPVVPDGHARHAPPDEPHALALVPATQLLVASQQPPLQVSPPAHVATHWCEVLHACSTGQSLEVLQPHDELAAMHAWPTAALVQSMQVMPEAPHAVVVLPAAQVPPLQQAPLHGWLAEHEVMQVLVVVLHDEPAGQSLGPLQPHAPPPAIATHTMPMLVMVVQLVQAAPFEPQPVAAVPPTHEPDWQQPPLQILVASHAAPHRCVVRSQASPALQSVDALQPHMPAMHTCPLSFALQSGHGCSRSCAMSIDIGTVRSGIERSSPGVGMVPSSQQ
jgi:hypothetical protein